jgi:hypothetical protein
VRIPGDVLASFWVGLKSKFLGFYESASDSSAGFG